jgi:hypothetical protein
VLLSLSIRFVMDQFVAPLIAIFVGWMDQLLGFVAARPTESLYVAIAAGALAAFQLARRKAL